MKKAEKDDRQSGMTSFASSISMWYCDASSVELMDKMLTGDILLLLADAVCSATVQATITTNNEM